MIRQGNRESKRDQTPRDHIHRSNRERERNTRREPVWAGEEGEGKAARRNLREKRHEGGREGANERGIGET